MEVLRVVALHVGPRNFHGAFAVRNILGLAKGIANLRNLRVLSIDIGG